jgi:hypothetical protein
MSDKLQFVVVMLFHSMSESFNELRSSGHSSGPRRGFVSLGSSCGSIQRSRVAATELAVDLCGEINRQSQLGVNRRFAAQTNLLVVPKARKASPWA